MLETFLFIPADKPSFFKALGEYSPDHFILDLEDSIIEENREQSIVNLENIGLNNQSCYVRLPNLNKVDLIISIVKRLYPKFSKYILPKVDDALILLELSKNLDIIIPIVEQHFILTIESPKGLINLHQILSINRGIIYGLSFGSHDYCREMNAKNEEENYSFARQFVLNYAKAFGLKSIDIASTNLGNEEDFKLECLGGFNLGFDAKPLLHPWQLKQISIISFYSENEIEEAISVYKEMGNTLPDEISAIKLEGKIIETPHLNKYKRIIKYVIQTKPELL